MSKDKPKKGTYYTAALVYSFFIFVLGMGTHAFLDSDINAGNSDVKKALKKPKTKMEEQFKSIGKEARVEFEENAAVITFSKGVVTKKFLDACVKCKNLAVTAGDNNELLITCPKKQ